MNILSNMEDVADLIIRPTRYLYKPMDLGPKIINVDGQPVYHHDFDIKNNRNLLLKASLYTASSSLSQINNVIVYLHCNSGCRVQGLAYLKMSILNNFSYFVFDFAGSGLSDGRYISLGYHQVDDVATVLKFLHRNLHENLKIVLWGRSMGAVTALRYLALNKNPKNVIASVFDSPFHSLRELFLEIGKQKTSFPKLVLEMALKYIKPIIKDKANFNLDDVNLSNLEEIDCPGVFIASKKDSLIPFSQMDLIFRQYKGEKQMLFVEQSHNEPRCPDVIQEVFKGLKKYFHIPSHFKNQQNETMLSHLPQKETSRKKLQLTIKSYSQRTLLIPSEKSIPKKNLEEIPFPQLQKRHISCLLNKKKKPLKKSLISDIDENSECITSSSLLKLKKPIVTHKFFRDQNKVEVQNAIKFKSNRGQQINLGQEPQNPKVFRDQERKTMQHMANKKPPLIEQNRLSELRNSLEIKYKTELRK